MSKRTLDLEEPLPDIIDWGVNWGSQPSPPPSPPVLLEEVEAQPSTLPTSLYTTLGSFEFALAIKNVLSLPYHLACRFLRPQRILAVPVIREDGSRKKRLIGLDQTENDATQPRRKFTRRVLLSRELRTKRTSPIRLNIPGQWPESPSPQQPDSDNIWVETATDGSAPPSDNIWMDVATLGPTTSVASAPVAPTPIQDCLVHTDTLSPCAQAASRRPARLNKTPPSVKAAFKRIENPSIRVRNLLAETAAARNRVARNAAAEAATFHANSPFDHDLGSPACASTPYGGYVTNTMPTAATAPGSRQVLSPPSKEKNPITTQVPYLGTIRNKHLDLGRSNTTGNHTQPPNIRSPRMPLKTEVHKSVACQLAMAKVTEDARKIEDNLRKARDARQVEDVRKALDARRVEDLRKARAEYQPALGARFLEVRPEGNAKLQSMEDAEKAEESFEYKNDMSNLSDAEFAYVNDMSTLSDAPPLPLKKTVTLAPLARAKPFYHDSKVADMLDSYLEEVKTCDDPMKARTYIQQGSPASDTDAVPLPHASPEPTDGGDSVLLPPGSPASSTGGESLILPQGSPSPSNGRVYGGVPKETFFDSDESVDDSLEESMMSSELLGNLFEEVEKQLLISPPQQQPVPPVAAKKPLVAELTKSEQDTLEAAVKLTEKGALRSAVVVKGIELVSHDFSTLLPKLFDGDTKAWVNDNIVNEYLSVLLDHQKKKEGWTFKRGGDAPPVHAYGSHWYTNMKKGYSRVERWARRANLDKKKLLDAKLVLFPICDQSHWRLLAIKPQERLIEYYDSLGGLGQQYTDVALKYLEAELGEDYVASEWSVCDKQKSMRQDNASDCGIFTLLNALVLLRGEEHGRVVVSDGMQAARRRIAITLMARKPTTEMD
jgi:hypothetical protein